MKLASFPQIQVGEMIEAGEAELQTGPFGTQMKASEYTETGTTVINVRNIGMGNIKAGKLEFIPNATRDRLSSHILRSGDIVFGRKGAVERHVFIRKEQDGWFQGSDCLRLRFISSRVLPLFASYFFTTKEHQQWMMNQCSHGATMASLNQDILKRINLPSPELQIQENVIGILSAYDELIENSKKRIEVLDSMVRLLYREWFVRFRFPGHESVIRVPSPLCEIPPEWEVLEIAELAEIVLGGTPSRNVKEYWTAGTIPWLKSGQLNDFRVIEGTELITRSGLENSATKLMPPRTVLIAITGAILISFLEIEACANQSVIGIHGAQKVSQEYLHIYLRENISVFESKMSGSAQQHINKEIVKRTKILVPPPAIADAFSSLVQPAYEEIRTLLLKIQNLGCARDLLLPRLLSGQIDVEIAA